MRDTMQIIHPSLILLFAHPRCGALEMSILRRMCKAHRFASLNAASTKCNQRFDTCLDNVCLVFSHANQILQLVFRATTHNKTDSSFNKKGISKSLYNMLSYWVAGENWLMACLCIYKVFLFIIIQYCKIVPNQQAKLLSVWKIRNLLIQYKYF